MDITTKSVIELKALAYDQLKILEQTQINLRALNVEMEKREKEPKEEPKQ